MTVSMSCLVLAKISMQLKGFAFPRNVRIDGIECEDAEPLCPNPIHPASFERKPVPLFAEDKQDIDTVIKTIEKDAADHCTQKVIEREAICNLSKGQMQQVKKLEAKYDVIVNIEQTIGRISVRGDTEDVLDVATTIYEVLNQKIEEEHARGVGELLSKNVQWFFYDSDDDDETPEPYEPSINLQIEEAFGEGKDSVIVLIDEEKCEIVFKDMKETCLDSGEVRVVVRKEIGKGTVQLN